MPRGMGPRTHALVADPRPVAWGAEQLEGLRRDLERGGGKTYDLVVVGAGISGAGVARDAAMRGLSVLVLEGADVAFGTSSRSTRLIHGGVRYLEQGQIGLVYEALRERARLYQSVPHLVKPARFLFPAYAGDRLRPWKLRAGLALYDLLSLYRGKVHNGLSAEATLAAEPLLAAEGLQGAVQYEDAVTDDARLTVTVLQSALRHGADALTYARVERVEKRDDPAAPHRVYLQSGGHVDAQAVMLATGPWTGRKLLGDPGRDLLSLSKGIHLVVRREDAPVRAPVVVQVRGQRRILFVVPWGPRTYLGTTDTSYEGDPGQSGISATDHDEVIELVSRVLTGAKLRPDRVISGWSGVRPLVRARRKRGGTEELARTHRIVANDDGVMALVGGKLTTYRAMAEEAVDEVVRRLGDRAPEGLRPCGTTRGPVVEGSSLDADELDDPLLADLEPRHGPLARVLAARCVEAPALAERLAEDLPYRWVEVAQAIEHEGAAHLDDVLRRRLPMALTDVRRGGGVARRVAEMLVDARGGGEADLRAELDRYVELTERETGQRPLL